MRKFFSELLTPNHHHLPISQQENYPQCPYSDSMLESVLTSDDNHFQYGSEEQLAMTTSRDIKIQDALGEVEKKIESIQADYSKWNYLSIINATISSLVPPATYATFGGWIPI